MRVHPIQIGFAVLCGLPAAASAQATVQRHGASIVELVGQSDLILRGTIRTVTEAQLRRAAAGRCGAGTAGRDVAQR